VAETRILVAADHPSLPGHFPGSPLVPGVVLLDWAWQACREELPQGTRLLGLLSAKFLSPVRPGDQLRIVTSTGTHQSDFSLWVGEISVAQGRFSHG
jgi:3-hydroxymyristoyl/3-hydroxydecanoyl-(acyl carrier protein) dehydratase